MKTILAVALLLVLAAAAQASMDVGTFGNGGTMANIYADDGTPLIINQGSNPFSPSGGMYINRPDLGSSITMNWGPAGSAISTTTPRGTLSAFHVPDPANLPQALQGTHLGANIQAVAGGDAMVGIPRGEDNYGFDANVGAPLTVTITNPDGTTAQTTVTNTQSVDWASYFDPNSDYSADIDSGGSGLTLSQRKFLGEGDAVPDGHEAYALRFSDPSSRGVNPNLRVARVGSAEIAAAVQKTAQSSWMSDAITEDDSGLVAIGDGKI
jgi:hypothetical protein